jgi:hypothetical protein
MRAPRIPRFERAIACGEDVRRTRELRALAARLGHRERLHLEGDRDVRPAPSRGEERARGAGEVLGRGEQRPVLERDAELASEERMDVGR